MLASLTLLTPAGALAAATLLVPVAAIALAARRVRVVRAALGLRAPRHGTDLVAFGALAAAFVLVGLAAAQPALSHDAARRVRKDAQVLFVLDTSRSMAAAPGPSARTRLERAEAAATALRAAVPDVESGVATLTDRVLPDLLPVADSASFDAVLGRAVGIERPPPRNTAVRATSFAALAAVPAAGFFAASASHRAIVLLTDGESRPYDPGEVGRALGRTGLVLVRVGGPHEAVYGPGGQPETAYRPDPSAPAILDALAAATNGRVFSEGDLAGAAHRLRELVGNGPTAQARTRSRREKPRAPYALLVALVPLGFFVRRRGG
jgi:hypothetical protein